MKYSDVPKVHTYQFTTLLDVLQVFSWRQKYYNIDKSLNMCDRDEFMACMDHLTPIADLLGYKLVISATENKFKMTHPNAPKFYTKAFTDLDTFFYDFLSRLSQHRAKKDSGETMEYLCYRAPVLMALTPEGFDKFVAKYIGAINSWYTYKMEGNYIIATKKVVHEVDISMIESYEATVERSIEDDFRTTGLTGEDFVPGTVPGYVSIADRKKEADLQLKRANDERIERERRELEIKNNPPRTPRRRSTPTRRERREEYNDQCKENREAADFAMNETDGYWDRH